MNHTPTPYTVYENESGGFDICEDQTGYLLAETCYQLGKPNAPKSKEDQQANADFIVRACNSHDDLVKAVSWAIIELQNEAPKSLIILDLKKVIDEAKRKSVSNE